MSNEFLINEYTFIINTYKDLIKKFPYCKKKYEKEIKNLEIMKCETILKERDIK